MQPLILKIRSCLLSFNIHHIILSILVHNITHSVLSSNFPCVSKFKSYSIQLLCFFLNLFSFLKKYDVNPSPNHGVHHFQKLNYQNTNIPISKPNQTLLDKLLYPYPSGKMSALAHFALHSSATQQY